MLPPVDAAPRIEVAPERRPFPQDWAPNLQATPRGRIIYLRRTGSAGGVELLGRHFEVDALWPTRLVHAEVELDAGQIRFHALRRRNPPHQPLLREVAYRLPRRRFQEWAARVVTCHRNLSQLSGECCHLAFYNLLQEIRGCHTTPSRR